MTEDDETATGTAPPDPGFLTLLESLRERYNFDFREYKEASLMRRVRGRMTHVHTETFEAYARFLDTHPEEHVMLFNAILINVTSFFRDGEAWAALREQIVPRMVENAEGSRSIRVWSAGCSSGEEAYSLAILLAEHLGDRAATFQIRIYGTDLDEDALSAARQATYRTEQLKEVPDHLLERYFTREGQLWKVRRDLRRWCIFGAHNLTQMPPLSHIDLLVCRNVLIYFGSALQERIITRFHYALREGGFLFLGRSESLLARSRLFAPVQVKWRLFHRLPGSSRTVSSWPIDASLVRADAVRHEGLPSAIPMERALEALPSPTMVVDAADTIIAWNHAAAALFETPSPSTVGHKFRDIDVSYRVEGLRARMEEVKAHQLPVRLEEVTFARRSGDFVHANIAIVPIVDAYRVVGLVVTVEDATGQARLAEELTRVTEQHATAIEELQSTNEELETTNEELQSTNEELETTNEELQSTNEELETTVEELQAANAELAALNGELEERGAELTRVDAYHRGVVDGIEQAVLVVDRDGKVRTWSKGAERLLGLAADQAIGREVFALPLGDVLPRLRAAFDRMLSSLEAQELENVALPGLPARRGIVRLSPVRDGSRGLLGAVATVQLPDPGPA